MVACPVCGHDVDWVTVSAAAQLLKVTPARVRQFILKGRLPGAVKYRPGGGIAPLWKIPITSVVALHQIREEEA